MTNQLKSNLSRREIFGGFCAASLLGLSGCVSPFETFSQSKGTNGLTPSKKLKKIGIQLYTVRNIFQPEPVATLKKVAAVGYKEVEFGGGNFENMDHKMLKKALDDLGLKAPSMHASFESLRDKPQAVINMAGALGVTYVVVPYLVNPLRDTKDLWKASSQAMNLYGEKLKKHGLEFLYHNHEFEFKDMGGGETGYDIFLRESDPKLVKIELDLFWVTLAKKDPIAIMTSQPGRIKAFHVKDMSKTWSMVNVGEGTIDFAAIFSHAKAAGVEHYFVEHDGLKTEDYEAGMIQSFKHLNALRFS